MDGFLNRLVEMHAELVRCDEWSAEWVRLVDMMARVLDSIACEFGHVCLLEVMCRFSERTGDGLHIDAAQLQQLASSGAVVIG